MTQSKLFSIFCARDLDSFSASVLRICREAAVSYESCANPAWTSRSEPDVSVLPAKHSPIFSRMMLTTPHCIMPYTFHTFFYELTERSLRVQHPTRRPPVFPDQFPLFWAHENLKTWLTFYYKQSRTFVLQYSRQTRRHTHQYYSKVHSKLSSRFDVYIVLRVDALRRTAFGQKT